jgi:hypothetical protein
MFTPSARLEQLERHHGLCHARFDAQAECQCKLRGYYDFEFVKRSYLTRKVRRELTNSPSKG